MSRDKTAAAESEEVNIIKKPILVVMAAGMGSISFSTTSSLNMLAQVSPAISSIMSTYVSYDMYSPFTEAIFSPGCDAKATNPVDKIITMADIMAKILAIADLVVNFFIPIILFFLFNLQSLYINQWLRLSFPLRWSE